MGKFIDRTGERHGRLLVIERGPDHITAGGQKHTTWKCLCDCGNTVVVPAQSLSLGRVKSCGCLQKERTSEASTKHGDSKTGSKYNRLYHIWKGMRARCASNRAENNPRYAGRGIAVCDEWQDYLSFKEWALTNGYDDSLSIDRIDVDGDYEPSNCRWATMTQQQRNRSNNRYINVDGETVKVVEYADEHNITKSAIYTRLKNGKHPLDNIYKNRKYITFNGETHHLKEWATIINISYTTLKERLRRGWTVERALTTPTIDTGRWPVNA